MSSDRAQANPTGGVAAYLPIALLLLAYLAVELALFQLHGAPLEPAEIDGIGYMERATGPVFQIDPFHPIGYSLAIRAVGALGFETFTAAKLAALLFGAVYVFATWLLFSSFGSRREALLGTTLVAFCSAHVIWSGSILSDTMAAGLGLLSLALVLHAREAGRWRYLLAGMVAGAAYLTRYVFLMLLGVPVLVWLLNGPKRKDLLSGLAPALWFLGGFMLVTLPWMVFVFQQKGSPFWNELYLNIALKMHGAGGSPLPPIHTPTIAEDYRGQYSGMLGVILSDVPLFLRSWLGTLAYLPRALMKLLSPVGFIASVGLFLWVASLDRRKAAFLLVNLGYALVVSMVWIQARFLVFFLPLIAAGVASAAFAVPSRLTHVDLPSPVDRLVGWIPLRALAIALLLGQVGLDTWRNAPDYFTPR